ncbi:hypothetical protein BpHYR1_041909, partial [Brachionus plicatilis]
KKTNFLESCPEKNSPSAGFEPRIFYMYDTYHVVLIQSAWIFQFNLIEKKRKQNKFYSLKSMHQNGELKIKVTLKTNFESVAAKETN